MDLIWFNDKISNLSVHSCGLKGPSWTLKENKKNANIYIIFPNSMEKFKVGIIARLLTYIFVYVYWFFSYLTGFNKKCNNHLWLFKLFFLFTVHTFSNKKHPSIYHYTMLGTQIKTDKKRISLLYTQTLI